jgi:hypothetical protein
VDSGYIVYVGSGEDFTQERATFKAEGQAIQDVANECSFSPKGTRVEDHYIYFSAGKYQSFAKIGVSIDDCEAAKNTTDPAKIQTVANVAMTQQLQHYQQMEYNLPPAGTPPGTVVASNAGDQGANPNIYSTDAPPPIANSGEFFIVRQPVAYANQVVILSPPATYAPGTPASQTYTNQVAPARVSVRNYEQTNPQTKTWSNSWSSFERNPTVPIPGNLPRRRSYAPPGGMRNNGMRPYQQKGRGQNPKQPQESNSNRRGRKRNPELWQQ